MIPCADAQGTVAGVIGIDLSIGEVVEVAVDDGADTDWSIQFILKTFIEVHHTQLGGGCL